MADNPSEKVHDVYRRRNYGVVNAQDNTKPTTDSFHVDRSRLGEHEEYDPEAKNDWGGTGKYVKKPNSIMDNVRREMGDLGHCSSFKDVNAPAEPTNTDCCPGFMSYPGARNPVRRRRGDE